MESHVFGQEKSGWPVPFLDLIKAHRFDIQESAVGIKDMINHRDLFPKEGDPECKAKDTNEVIANLMLAYRHLEDARMRLGKVYEAWEGGSNATR